MVEYKKMTKSEKKRYDALLKRVTDIYSGAIGAAWDDDSCIVGAEELAVIAPAILDRLYPDAPGFISGVGYWLSNLGSPDQCAEWLWTIKYHNPQVEI